MQPALASLTLLALALPALSATFNLAQEYAGSTWFDKWDFYGDTGIWNGTTPWDNTTVGACFVFCVV